MSTIRRVPLDFDHPQGITWPGYLMPESLRETGCSDCGGTGYSERARYLHDRWYGKVPFRPIETGSTSLTIETPEVREFAESQVARSAWYYGFGEEAIVREARRISDLWNGAWSHHLAQEDVDALIEGGRLWNFVRDWVPGTGWVPKDPQPVVTAEEVNRWSIRGMGHDSLNCGIVIRAACKREGVEDVCATCKGHGSIETYPGQRAEVEAWEPTEPPTGEGWQRWEYVGEGSPTSAVFATPEALADWLCTPAAAWGAGGPLGSREEAMRVVLGGGGGDFLIGTSGSGVITADEALARSDG